MPPAVKIRAAGRATAAFLLDFVEIGRGDRTLIDGLILAAMIQANVEQVVRQPDLQRSYGAYDEAPPDAMRRPTSVSAIANSLRLPYETVRRRIAHLADQGLCVVTAAGAYVPQAVLTSPEHMAAVFRAYELLRQFYYRLSDLGVLTPAARAAEAPVAGVELVRAIMRVLGEYFLRSVDAVTAAVRDLQSGLLLLAILRANTEHLADDAGADQPDEMPRNADRRPISVAALAERVRLPPETARRHVAELVRDGFCVRVQGGLVVPGELLARPQLTQMVNQNISHVSRMFASLAELGVLAAWDAARPAASSAQTALP